MLFQSPHTAHCIIQWPPAHSRLRGELVGAWATSKSYVCVRVCVCCKPSPDDLPFSLASGFTTGMFFRRARAVMSEGCEFRTLPLQLHFNFSSLFFIGQDEDGPHTAEWKKLKQIFLKPEEHGTSDKFPAVA